MQEKVYLFNNFPEEPKLCSSIKENVFPFVIYMYHYIYMNNFSVVLESGNKVIFPRESISCALWKKIIELMHLLKLSILFRII